MEKFMRIFIQNFKVIIFIVGILLTTERGYECFQKYLYSNTSTKITMVSSNETFPPVLIICGSFNALRLNQIGIRNVKDYKKGQWFGNSTLDGHSIFRFVTYDLSDLLQRFSVRFKSGNWTEYTDKDAFKSMNVTERGHKSSGRCFEIKYAESFDNVFKVQIILKKSVRIYLSMMNFFYNENSKSRFKANVGENLGLCSITYKLESHLILINFFTGLEITYEILKSNFDKRCKFYDYNITYDDCKASYYEQKVLDKFNCTVPYKLNSEYKICKGKSNAKVNFETFFLNMS